MRVLLVGGGTGGHIYPALALAEGIKREVPDSEILFVGTHKGLEAKIVPEHGYEFRTVDIAGIDRSSPARAVAALARVPRSLGQAGRIVRDFDPDVVVGTGGYVSFPVVWQAARMGYPTAVHEQNAFPGLANRLLAKRVDLVMLTFDEARAHLKARKVVCTGLPVRQAILEADRNQARRELKIPWGIFTLLIFGGSLGARSINSAVEGLLGLSADRQWHVIWVTGPAQYDEYLPAAERIRGRKLSVEIHPYLNNIEVAMAASDLVVARAGASTLSELSVLGLPAILIPYPFATDNHQEKNALALADSGAATVIADSELSGDRLFEEIECLVQEDRLYRMGRAMRAKGRPGALREMVSLVLGLAKRRYSS